MNRALTNNGMIGFSGNGIVLGWPGGAVVTKREALECAAWIVAMAETRPGEFDEVLRQVRAAMASEPEDERY